MEIIAIIGTIIASLAGSGLLVAILNRKRDDKTAEITDAGKITEIALNLLPRLRDEVDALKREVEELKTNLAEHQHTITQQLHRIVQLQTIMADQATTIKGMQAMITVQTQQLEERDRVIVHQQGEINQLLAKVANIEKVQTGTLRMPSHE